MYTVLFVASIVGVAIMYSIETECIASVICAWLGCIFRQRYGHMGSAPKVSVSFNVCGRRESTVLWKDVNGLFQKISFFVGKYFVLYVVVAVSWCFSKCYFGITIS